jgi:hypothetical protein
MTRQSKVQETPGTCNGDCSEYEHCIAREEYNMEGRICPYKHTPTIVSKTEVTLIT